MVKEAEIAPAQLRAARAWLAWSQDKLADESGISKKSIARYEQGRALPYDGTLATLKSTLEANGIRFHSDGTRQGISGSGGWASPER